MSRVYDVLGRLSAETQTIGGIPYIIGYGYDSASRQIQMTYPGGKVLQRTFTARGQLQSLTFDGTAVVSIFVYDPGMRDTSRTYGNGITETRTWRTDNRLESIQAPGVINLGYSWDTDKNKTAETNGLFPSKSQAYGYDAEDRLTSFSRTGGDSQSWGLSLEGDWNNFTKDGQQDIRQHNPVHELTQIDQQTLLYDAKGNLIQDQTGRTYGWDVEDRLACVSSGGGTLGAYAYDVLGRRVSKTADGIETVFINDGWQEIREYDDGVLARSFVFGAFMDEPLLVVSGLARHYYHANHLYSVLALTDSTGEVIERYDYDPYGGWTILSPDGFTVRPTSLFANPWSFTGRRFDTETGLLYYRSRIYDTHLGRFISRDPIGRYDCLFILNSASILIPANTIIPALNPLNGKGNGRFTYIHVTLGELIDVFIYPYETLRNNLYEYCGTQPTQMFDGLGLWGWDTHGFLTKSMSLVWGICDECCSEIAGGNQRTDISHIFTLVPHFLRVASDDPRDIVKEHEKWRDSRYEKGCQLALDGDCENGLARFGEALHAVQDRYAHSKDGDGDIPMISDIWGGGEHRELDADNPNTPRGRKAFTNSTIETFNWMKYFKDNCMGCCCSFPKLTGQKEGTKTLCK